jgi:hypothetical protein
MKDYNALKLKIHQQCQKLIDSRIIQTEASIKDLRQEAQLHAKSSAGDKYETGRAMADLEIEKYQKSLNNLLQMSVILNRIDATTHQEEMAHGALICTDKVLIYLAVALGKINVDGQNVLVISLEAPLYNVLKNAPIGSKAVFNGQVYNIKNIV